MTSSYTERNGQIFMCAYKKENEGVNEDLFHIRVWFIIKQLRNNLGSNTRNVEKLCVCLAKRVSQKTHIEKGYQPFLLYLLILNFL